MPKDAIDLDGHLFERPRTQCLRSYPRLIGCISVVTIVSFVAIASISMNHGAAILLHGSAPSEAVEAALVGPDIMPACGSTCSYKGRDFTCQDLILYAAKHGFAHEADPCSRSHEEVIKWYPACALCSVERFHCVNAIAGVPAEQSCKAYGCIANAVLDGCSCSSNCASLGECCADYDQVCAAVWHTPVQPQAPTGPYINQYDPNNPLRIQSSPVRSNNFFLLLGDWGKAFAPGPCQLSVAQKMREYVASQREQGKNLLFVGTVGDNFYWTGVAPEMWGLNWAEVYDVWDPRSSLYLVPWLSVLGNHDLGNVDGYALCPHVLNQRIHGGQYYGSNQFNADRNPTRPDYGCDDPGVAAREPARCMQNTSVYWMPDYNWHYELPEASLEVIGIDTNSGALGILGGDETGHNQAFQRCGGPEVVRQHMTRVGEAGRALLEERARIGTASTVVILQHYPGMCMRDAFLAAVPPARRGAVRVLCAYGHVHDQRCDGRDPVTGTCNSVLTGGGGGCCAEEGGVAGFTAVHLEDDGGFTVDVESPQVRLKPGQCDWAAAR